MTRLFHLFVAELEISDITEYSANNKTRVRNVDSKIFTVSAHPSQSYSEALQTKLFLQKSEEARGISDYLNFYLCHCLRSFLYISTCYIYFTNYLSYIFYVIRLVLGPFSLENIFFFLVFPRLLKTRVLETSNIQYKKLIFNATN